MKLKASVKVRVDTIKKAWRKGKCKLLDHRWSEGIVLVEDDALTYHQGGRMQECERRGCEATRWVA